MKHLVEEATNQGSLAYPERAFELITQLQEFYATNSYDAARMLGGAAQFVALPDLSMWGHGGALKEELGGKALLDVGFINALESSEEIREAAISSFLDWAEGLNVSVNLSKRLDRAVAGQITKPFRLLVWPDAVSLNSRLGSIPVEEMDGPHDNYVDFGAQFLEGGVVERRGLTHTRDPKLVRLAREAWNADICCCCGADKTGTGSSIRPTLQMHHLTPIREGQRYSTVYDLRPVCPTCHVELHLGGKRSIEEFQASR